MSGSDGHSSQSQPMLIGQTLIIEDEGVPVQFRNMPLKDLKLDPSNPRIQHAVKQANKNGQVSATELRKLILEQPGVSDLFKSIRDNGGVMEPIYVRPDGTVIEGNCRAACCLRLHEIKKDDPKWLSIPAYFVPKISDRQVAILQGQYHVAGKNKWRAYEKIGHMHHMFTKLNMDEKAIAQSLGLKERDVTRDLKAYETMTQKLLPKINGGNGLEKWSFVQELYKRKDLEEFRTKPENIDHFVTLIVEKKLKQGTDVRRLGKIIKHPSAVKVLKKSGVAEAMLVVGKADPTADSRTFQKLKETTTLLKRLQGKDLDRLKEDRPRQLLEELFTAIKEAAKAAGVKLR